MLYDVEKDKRLSPVVGLFGEILADIFPEQSVLGGAPFNVARHLQAFNIHPVLITRTGNDALREELMQEMSNKGLDICGVQCDSVYPTGQVKVVIENGTHHFDILPDQAYDHIHPGITHMVSISIKPELAYFGTLAQRGMESRLALDKFLSDCKCPRFLDLNLRKPYYNKHMIRRSLLRSDIVKMNDGELEIIAQYFKLKGQNHREWATDLLERFELDKVLITCGSQGSWMVNRQSQFHVSEPDKIDHPIIDTVGAGDAYAAIFILGMLVGWEIQDTLKRANHFASAICGVKGAAPSNDNFYMPFKKAWGL